MTLPERIETERLVLQRLRYEDESEIFYTYASKIKCTRYMSWATHQDLKDTRAYLRYADNSWRAGVDFSWGIRLKNSNRFIGSCGVINEHGKIQFGYIFGYPYWGHGYATEVCRKLLAMLKTIPEVYRINTFVDVDNVASLRVLIKCGMVQEALLSKWFRFVNQDDEPKDCVLFKLPL